MDSKTVVMQVAKIGSGSAPSPQAVEIAPQANPPHGSYLLLEWEDPPEYLVVMGHMDPTTAWLEMQRGFIEDDYGEQEDLSDYAAPVRAWASWVPSDDSRWDHVLRLWRNQRREPVWARRLPGCLRWVVRLFAGIAADRFPVMVAAGRYTRFQDERDA